MYINCNHDEKYIRVSPSGYISCTQCTKEKREWERLAQSEETKILDAIKATCIKCKATYYKRSSTRYCVNCQ